MIPSLINAVIAVLAYVVLTSWQKKLNVIEYMKSNKAVLGITVGILFLVSMFGTAALMLAIVTFLVPYLVAYSVPSIVAKVVDIWGVVVAWLKSKTQ
jgi:uncharacterized membrane protein